MPFVWARRGYKNPETEVIDDWSHVGARNKTTVLQEHQVLLTSEPSQSSYTSF